jgi:hypothetical protein
MLASRHRGTVAVVPFLEPHGALERATAATSRIVLQVAGLVPRVYGAHASLERAILSAVASMEATLLVLPLDSRASARNNAALIARLVGCSVLVIPVPAVIPEPPPPLGPPTGVRLNRGRERPAVGRRTVPQGSLAVAPGRETHSG